MKISDQQIEQIREATNIVDLVGEHVHLRKSGRNLKGLCPFHTEKTPSFNVLEDRGIFKCFGCGKGGDVFSFVMQMEGLTFPEAAERLAKRANIELQNVSSDEDDRIKSEREAIFEALRAAAGFYYRLLRAPEGKRAMDYLKGRGLEDEILRKFGLGYSPETSGVLTAALTKQGFSTEVLEAAGILAHRDSGDAHDRSSTYERFRGRVIFPVFGATGRIVGFGGRIMPGTSKEVAKYINSPDTSVYHKSQILYGLFQAKDAVRRRGFAVLVEGYADVLAVFQSGVENVVAASGTSLTIDQLGLLKRYTTDVVLLFDADAAGKNATNRGIELAIEAGFDVNTVVLPAGEDPDSFIRANGAAAFEAAIERRQSFIETKAQYFEEQGAFRDPGRMAIALRSIVETIAKVPDAIKRALYIQKLGERFHLSEQMLTIELQKILSTERRTPPTRVAQVETIPDDLPANEAPPQPQEVPRSEASLLEAMIEDPHVVAHVIDEVGFNLDLVRHPSVREVISFLMQEIESGETPTIAQLLDEYRDKPERDLLIRFGMTQNTFSDRWEAPIEDGPSVPEIKARQAMAKIELATTERHLQDLRKQLIGAIDQHEVAELQRETLALAQRIQVLKQWTTAPPVQTTP
ncbi:MAG: DNA primase [Bacteroidota bacterium]|nr:DNA primase [Bacteroidota bacterium]MDP4233157.1 DNA primase [Bacteroidota bacterium]MDP4241698.1 DNA primase [Bacteroidota bacterium]MDP4287356.1 DNA primase [Bacteroidota bacterium]